MKCSEAEVGRGEWRTHHIESKRWFVLCLQEITGGAIAVNTALLVPGSKLLGVRTYKEEEK